LTKTTPRTAMDRTQDLIDPLWRTDIHLNELTLGPRSIRVNAIHPTSVDTDMLHNEPMYRTFRPDLESPTRADAELPFPFLQAMSIPYVDPSDISHAVVCLACDESRFVTGQQLFVDAGAGLKMGL
jgi:NAD(P)-dependent dehydrogenase (short-subunit alcohol dehydrogenase family)